MACVNSSSFGYRSTIFQPYILWLPAASLFWHGFPNGAVSTGHPAILSITQLACCSTIEKGRWHRQRRTTKPFLTITYSTLGWRVDPHSQGSANSPPLIPSLQRHAKGQETG